MTHTLIAEVPLVPAAGAIIGYLGSLLIFGLAVALSVLWVNILRGPLIRLAAVSVLRYHPFNWLAEVVTNVDNWLKAAEQGGERGMTWSLHTLMWSLSTSAKLTRDLAHATWSGLEWERRHTTRHVSAPVPQSIDPRIRTLEREYKGIDAKVKQIDRREQAQRAAGAAAGTIDHAHLQRGIDRLAKRTGTLEHEVAGLEHAQSHAGAKAKPGAVPVPRTAPRVVPRTNAPAHHWTDVLTKAAGATLVIAALARLGLSWLRCPALSRIGRKIGCGGFSLLEDLLALSFDAWLVSDLCKIVTAMTNAAKLFAAEIDFLATQIGGLIQCQGAQRAAPLPVAWYEPPAVVNSLEL